MYSRISIKNFRGIGSLEVDGLRRINLIVGRNNSGKTTFLESLFLLGGANDPHLCHDSRSNARSAVGRDIPGPIMAIAVLQHGSKKSSPEHLGQWDSRTAGEDIDESTLRLEPELIPVRFDSLPRTRAEVARGDPRSELSTRLNVQLGENGPRRNPKIPMEPQSMDPNTGSDHGFSANKKGLRADNFLIRSELSQPGP